MFTVNSIQFLCLFSFEQVPKEYIDMAMTMTAACRKKHNATPEDIKSFMEGKIPETKTGKCTATCLLDQFKLVRKIYSKKIREIRSIENLKQISSVNGKSELDCNAIEQFAKKADAKFIEVSREYCEACKAPATDDK